MAVEKARPTKIEMLIRFGKIRYDAQDSILLFLLFCSLIPTSVVEPAWEKGKKPLENMLHCNANMEC